MIFNIIRKLPPKVRSHAALAQVVVEASEVVVLLKRGIWP